jgi:hypothetical protein
LKKNLKIFFIALGIFLILLSCRSRLRPKMFQVEENSRLKLDYVDSYWMDNFALSLSAEADPLSPGVGKVLISNQRRANPDRGEIETGLISAVAEINYRIYIDLPQNITTGSMDLKNKSICRLIGMFELDDRIKHYECREGFLKIDTVKSSRFHAQMYGKYFNYKNDSLVFEGDLNVKQKK